MGATSAISWQLRTRTVDTTDHTLIMGILNVTPDSFSDGGAFTTPGAGAQIDHEAAVAHAIGLVSDGADIVDVGGESTRPGAVPVTVAEEIDRVVPVVAALAGQGITVSIDTSKPEVARAVVAAGAEIVNDVTGLRSPEMVEACAELGAGVVIMHMLGEPRTMQDAPAYADVVGDIRSYLTTRADSVRSAGIEPSRICIDPGIGFGKTLAHNLQLLARLDLFTATDYPVLVGTSRKSFIGSVLDAVGRSTTPEERDVASAATAALAVAAGAAVVRVHNVAGTIESTRIADAIVRSASHQI